MSGMRQQERSLGELIEDLYRVFEPYVDDGTALCPYCYGQEELDRIMRTGLEELPEDDCRTLLWEAAGHLEGSEAYRHYLPRVLESIGPPMYVEDIYPGHLFETLEAFGFSRWNRGERDAVIGYLKAVRHAILSREDADEEDREAWDAGLDKLAKSDENTE